MRDVRISICVEDNSNKVYKIFRDRKTQRVLNPEVVDSMPVDGVFTMIGLIVIDENGNKKEMYR